MAKHVGIKELKDRASSIIDEVEEKRKPITITRNNKEVARIVPMNCGLNPKDLFRSVNEQLKELGRISQLPKQEWRSLKLKKISAAENDSIAIRAISEDRDER
jgi:prevent-host-death family protein